MESKAPTPAVLVRYEEGNFFVKVPFSLNHVIQELPDRRWWKSTREWKIPANWRVKGQLDRLRGGGAYWTEEAREHYDHIGDEPAELPRAKVPDYPFVLPPFGHQIEAYERALLLDKFALFLEQGLGKTKTTLDLAGMWYNAGLIQEVVVCCPVSVKLVWMKECAIHLPMKHEVQLMDTKNKPIVWSKDSGLRVLVVGIESMSQGNAYDKLFGYMESTGATPRLFVLDESSKVKNHKATRTERITTLASCCSKRLLLTGTPVTQGLQDLYSQFAVLDPDTLALNSFYAFRNRYCVMGGFEDRKIIGYKNVDELMGLIDPWSIRKTKEECLDLPEKIFQVRDVTMTPQQLKAYRELKKHLVTKIHTECGSEQTIEVKMILEAYLRLQQITGGFLPYDPSRDLDGPMAVAGANPKLNELKDLMDEIQGKVIVFARFRAEVEAISKALGADRKVVEFHGGLDQDEKIKAVDSFQEGNADVFVATPQAAAYGLTLTAASTAIYYSMGFSLEEFLQSQDRIHRIGQTRACTYILLQCSGSVDENVVTALTEKKSLADFVSNRLELGLDAL